MTRRDCTLQQLCMTHDRVQRDRGDGNAFTAIASAANADGDTFTDDSQNRSHRARVDEQPTLDEHKEIGDFEDEVDDGENSRVFPTPSAKEALFFFTHIQSFD